MKEKAKALISENQNELSAACALYVSLDRADNVIEGGDCCGGVMFDLSDGASRHSTAKSETTNCRWSFG